MATSAKVGANMTGVQMSPKDTKSLLEAVEQNVELQHAHCSNDGRGAGE